MAKKPRWSDYVEGGIGDSPVFDKTPEKKVSPFHRLAIITGQLGDWTRKIVNDSVVALKRKRVDDTLETVDVNGVTLDYASLDGEADNSHPYSNHTSWKPSDSKQMEKAMLKRMNSRTNKPKGALLRNRSD